MNGSHLSISGDIPLAKGSLSDAIGLDGEGATVEEILHGTYNMDEAGMGKGVSSSIRTSF